MIPLNFLPPPFPFTHTYFSPNTGRFALVDPDGNGSIALQVGRVHTSPFGKGPGRSASVVRAVDTSIGKIGGIMGFDLNFPQFVREVAADGVRLALVPAEDYGPIYALQWNQASLRAAAEGTTVVYCSSMYGLLVVDPYGSTVLSVPTPKDKTVAVLSGMVCRCDCNLPPCPPPSPHPHPHPHTDSSC